MRNGRSIGRLLAMTALFGIVTASVPGRAQSTGGPHDPVGSYGFLLNQWPSSNTGIVGSRASTLKTAKSAPECFARTLGVASHQTWNTGSSGTTVNTAGSWIMAFRGSMPKANFLALLAPPST